MDYALTTLNISDNNLTELPNNINKYTNLKILNCSCIFFSNLDNIPQSLETLYCTNNKLSNLNNLPETLIELNCSSNKLTQLDNLPQSLKILNCFYNPLKYNFEPSLENIRNYNLSNITK